MVEACIAPIREVMPIAFGNHREDSSYNFGIFRAGVAELAAQGLGTKSSTLETNDLQENYELGRSDVPDLKH